MPPRAVVLTFDRLHLGYLGCYGNDWIETPNFDKLATQSVLFDQHFAVDLRPHAAFPGWWSPSRSEEKAGSSLEAGLLEVFAASGVKTWLFAESDGRDAPSVAPPFDEITTVRGLDSLEANENEPPFARLVEILVERLPEIVSSTAPQLVWLKSRGVPAPWLPPLPFADLYLDEFGLESDSEADDDSEEAAPIDEQSAVVPAGAAGGEDPLIELKYARVLYAAYVTWLDRWLGKLLRVLESSAGWEETLLIVTAARGQSLGERGVLDEQATPLRAELIHTPLFIRVPDRQHDATRRASLVQLTDLGATLLDWFGLPIDASQSSKPGGRTAGYSLLPIVRNELDRIREFVFIEGPEEWGVRSRSSLYVQQRPRSGHLPEDTPALLFEKPADRWDMADVASQDPRECERLQQLLATNER